MAAGLRTAGFDEVVELPLADGGEGTLDALLAARGGSTPYHDRSPVRSATPSTRSGALLPDGTAVVEMARASGLALVDGPQRSAARQHPGHGRARSRRRCAAARSASSSASAGARRPTAGSPRSRRSAGRSPALDVTVACDVDDPVPRRGRASTARRRARPTAQVALLTRRLEQLAERVPSAHRRRRDRARGRGRGRRARGRARRDRRAARARLRRRRAGAPGSKTRSTGVDLVVTGEGKLDATSFEGKVVGGVLEWAADAGVPHRARDRRAGRPTRRARRLSCSATSHVLALTDRVWQAGEAFARAATARRGSRGRGRPPRPRPVEAELRASSSRAELARGTPGS